MGLGPVRLARPAAIFDQAGAGGVIIRFAHPDHHFKEADSELLRFDFGNSRMWGMLAPAPSHSCAEWKIIKQLRHTWNENYKRQVI